MFVRTLYLNGSNPRQECPQQEDGFNCGVFALAFLESLLNGDDIPSQVDTNALRNIFALRLRDTVPPEPASPLDGNLYPPPSSHLDQSTLPDCRTSPDPSEHDNTKPPTLDTKTCVQQLLESFRRDKNDLEEKAKRLVVGQEALSCMQQDLDSLQQEFEKDEENARDLQKQVKVCQMYLDWLKNCPNGNDLHDNQYLNKLKSNLESINKSTMEESHSLCEKWGSAQAKCNDRRKRIRQLQAKIDSHKTHQDGLDDSIAKAKKTLTDVKQMCAQILEE
jgi:cell division protein FtsL